MTLSLSDVSSRVSLSSVREEELYIRNMVCVSGVGVCACVHVCVYMCVCGCVCECGHS